MGKSSLTAKQRRAIVKHVSHRRLRLNLRILAVVYIILVIVTIVHLVRTPVSWWQAIICIALGLIVGIISSRMNKIAWDEDQEKVVGRFDIYGIVVLILFIAFELSRAKLAGLFVSGDAVGSASFLILTFAMYGRLIATSSKIIAIAKQEFLRRTSDTSDDKPE